jgi:hypothetical protein
MTIGPEPMTMVFLMLLSRGMGLHPLYKPVVQERRIVFWGELNREDTAAVVQAFTGVVIYIGE